MADKKISALTDATTPLAGTEVLPIVQSSTTKKVTVANLTAGRAISASSASISGDVSIGVATAISRLTVDAASSTPSTSNKGGMLLGTDTNVGLVFGAFTGAGSNFDGYIQAMDKRNGFATAYGLTLQPLGGNVTITNGDQIFGAAGKGLKFSGNNNVIWRVGSGSPEGVVTAPVGSLYTDTSGGAGTTFYVKESGAGNTGWIAK